MGNEYGAADFQPHLIPAIVYERLVDMDQTAGTTVTVVAGGYHPKMRLRYGYQEVIDLAIIEDGDTARLNVLHGSNAAVDSAHPHTDGDAVGTVDEFTIVDQYKDVAAADQVALEVEVQASDTNAQQMKYKVHLEYELVE